MRIGFVSMLYSEFISFIWGLQVYLFVSTRKMFVLYPIFTVTGLHFERISSSRRFVSSFYELVGETSCRQNKECQ